MLSNAVAVLLSYLAVASSRETYRPMPTITNSLVNLGKMEIAFYFSGNGRDQGHHAESSRSNVPAFLQKNEPAADEACPCSSLRNVKDSFLSNPTGILNKILMNNDLFSSHKEPFTSTLCCESHENVQEGTVVFEFPANQRNMKPLLPRNTIPITNSPLPMQMPLMPFLFENPVPNKASLPQLKTKSIEIFLFPKKKDMGGFEVPKSFSKKRDLVSKDNIQIVGDRELRNDVNLFKPDLPVVKKDLNLQEKNEKQIELKEEKKEDSEKEVVEQIIIEPASKPNAV
ncbi:uncharacterized protein LOC142975070 [Anticarsia gemmatalis]|uniref:uncharacterized protein LOC142975070 n=1 Tax=Anticarsia gemmatalis TaxID=129554 RepID=UPI003F7736E5